MLTVLLEETRQRLSADRKERRPEADRAAGRGRHYEKYSLASSFIFDSQIGETENWSRHQKLPVPV
jgi:hypothetical protein